MQNAIGYRMRGLGGCEPAVYIVHAVDSTLGFTIVIEADSHEYEVLERELLALLKSFRFES